MDDITELKVISRFNSNFKKFIQSIESMNLVIQNLYTSAVLVQSQTLCYNWTVSLQYRFLAMSHIWVTMDASPTYCQQSRSSTSDTEFVSKQNKPKTSNQRILVYLFMHFKFSRVPWLPQLPLARISTYFISLSLAWLFPLLFSLGYIFTRWVSFTCRPVMLPI
jgi:hypothetical protein